MSVVPKLAMLGLAATLSSPRRVQHVAGMRLIVRHIPNEIDCLPPICRRQATRDRTNARVGMPMVQSVIFGIVLYLTPSVLLLALLMCRKQFDFQPDELESRHPVFGRGR